MSGGSEFTAPARREHRPLLFRVIRSRARLVACALVGVAEGFVLPYHRQDT